MHLVHVAKDVYTYKELERRVGIPASRLSRYARSLTIPSLKRALVLTKALRNISQELNDKIREDPAKYTVVMERD
jgi:transcriptional regulator with XRE-family HTH domain